MMTPGLNLDALNWVETTDNITSTMLITDKGQCDGIRHEVYIKAISASDFYIFAS